jgi:hypothetical protein
VACTHDPFRCINCHGTPTKYMAKLIETPFWPSTMLCINIKNNNQHECSFRKVEKIEGAMRTPIAL